MTLTARTVGVAGSGAVQAVALLLLSAAFGVPAVDPGTPSTFHIDVFGERFNKPAISVSPIEAHVAVEARSEEGARKGDPCPPTPGVERAPAPVPNVEGRPLLWVAGLVADPIMCALIDSAGRVREVWVLRGSGDDGVDSAAVSALRAIPFRPAWSRGPRASRNRITGHLALRGWHYSEQE